MPSKPLPLRLTSKTLLRKTFNLIALYHKGKALSIFYCAFFIPYTKYRFCSFWGSASAS